MGWTADEIPDQTGRTVFITGANSGLGLRSAEALARKGARVLLGCRNATKAAAALDDVTRIATGPAPEVVPIDLADLDSVRAAADEVRQRTEQLDVLMNNAGVMGIPLARTAQGFEMRLGTNHLGHFALTGLLLQLLHQAPEPRVVTTSSVMHRTGRMRWDDLQWEKGYQRWPAYGQSKLANLLFTTKLASKASAARSPLLAAAAHPGYASTHLQDGVGLTKRLSAIGKHLFAQSDADGALPQLYAATMHDVLADDYLGPDQLFETRGAPTRVGRSSPARDRESASKLWNVSEELTGVQYVWPGGD
jgi:NAD(P)-dependent dehydrogenase (short-subunit alcohol dehydrogenase family)